MLLKALNNFIESNGLVIMLLVFGGYLKITKINSSLSSITQQTITIGKEIEDIWCINVKRQVQNILYIRNLLSTTKIHNLPVNSLVFVYRESRFWNNLYKLLSIEGEFAIISSLSRPTKFWTTVVRLYYQEVWEK